MGGLAEDKTLRGLLSLARPYLNQTTRPAASPRTQPATFHEEVTRGIVGKTTRLAAFVIHNRPLTAWK
jgi:hypothetical protein